MCFSAQKRNKKYLLEPTLTIMIPTGAVVEHTIPNHKVTGSKPTRVFFFHFFSFSAMCLYSSNLASWGLRLTSHKNIRMRKTRNYGQGIAGTLANVAELKASFIPRRVLTCIRTSGWPAVYRSHRKDVHQETRKHHLNNTIPCTLCLRWLMCSRIHRSQLKRTDI